MENHRFLEITMTGPKKIEQLFKKKKKGLNIILGILNCVKG
jgi:hypothetical protein